MGDGAFIKPFKTITDYIKLKQNNIYIDNVVFKLHYRITALIFFVCCLLVTSRQYIGEHIKCIADRGIAEHVMNTFCFFTSTFTVVKHLDDEMIRAGNIPHPGVGPIGFLSNEPVIHHNYYQWVPFFLFGQGIMFVLTHKLWKKIEGDRIKRLAEGLTYAAFAFSDKPLTAKDPKDKITDIRIPTISERDKQLATVKNAFLKGQYISYTWALGLITCEVLNAMHVLLQFYMINRFLGGKFYELGPRVVTEGLESTADVLDEVFPKVTKCNFHKYGPSGSIQIHDAMCVMALNVINDKIYTFLWFWLVFLFAVSVLAITWRMLTILLHSRSVTFNKFVFSPGRLSPWNMLTVTKTCNYKDWIFLKYLAKNMDPVVFKKFFIDLAEAMDDGVKQPLIDFQDEKPHKED